MIRKTLWAFLIFAAISTGNAANYVEKKATNNPLPAIRLGGNAHIDLAYRWRWNETVARVIPDTFWGVLRMMDEVPGLTFAQSQIALYEETMKQDPELFRQIKKRVDDKLWSVVGCQWGEPDEVLPCGEAHIRQFLIGQEFALKHLIKTPGTLVWTPDAFTGHASSLPKIYKGCGMEYYLFMRGAPEGKRIFWWESDDGSKLLAYNTPSPYNVRLFAPNMIDNLRSWQEITRYPEAFLIYGEGDHGGGPRDTDMAALTELKKDARMGEITFETPERYFDRLSKSGYQWPTHRGDMNIRIPEQSDDTWVYHTEGPNLGTSTTRAKSTLRFPTYYTSQAEIKKLNRTAENRLIAAETYASIGTTMQGKPFHPRVDLRETWKLLLRNQFHDILPGTLVADAADDATTDLNTVLRESQRIERFGLECIGSRIDTRGEGIPLVIYNPLSFTRNGTVGADVRFNEPTDRFTIKDHRGNNVDYTVDRVDPSRRQYHITLLATGIPSIGYSVLRIYPHQQPEQANGVTAETNRAENEYLKVTWNEQGLTSVWSKTLQRELLSAPGNQLRLMELAKSSSWNSELTGVTFPINQTATARLIESSPMRVVVEWNLATEESQIIQQMSLTKGSQQVDFKLKIDWADHDKVLKVFFPVTIQQGTATYEDPYGHVARPFSKTDLPAQNWIDLSNADYGVALYNNGRYGFMIDKGLMSMTVILNARDMDPRMDFGKHEIEYAIRPHAGGWKNNRIVQEALAFNSPMTAMQESKHDSPISGWTSKTALPPTEHSFFGVDKDNHVVISAVKVLQGDWNPLSMVIRLFETEGRNDEVTVTMPSAPARVFETNHVEAKLEKQPDIELTHNRFKVQIGHHQVRTFVMERDANYWE